MLKVTSVRPLQNASVQVTFSNAKTADIDISPYLNAPGYETLARPEIFGQVSVEEWGHGIEWPGDIGIPVTALHRLAREQAGQAWPVAQFNDWMQRNRLSAADAARALGVTRRTIIYYHTGTKPIPRMVELACEGFDARAARRGSRNRTPSAVWQTSA